MFCRKILITSLLLFGTTMATSDSSCKWLNRIVEYYKTKFLEEGHTPLTIKAILIPKPDGYEDYKDWSLDSILVLMVLIKESKAAELIHRAFRCISKPSKFIKLKTEANVSEPRTPKELVLVIDNNLQVKLPSSQISLKMIKQFLLSEEFEDWLNTNKTSRRMRRKNKRERIGGSAGLFKASGGGSRGGNRDYIKRHHSGMVEAGHQGDWIGDGHHVGWVTRGHHAGSGPARTHFPSPNHHGGSGRGLGSGNNWFKNYYHGGGANDKMKGGPIIGGGPKGTHFQSTIHHSGGRGRSVYYTGSSETWGKHRYHGGGRWDKNYYHRGRASDRGRAGPIIGGGPARTNFPSTSHGSGKGRNVHHADSGEVWSKHRYQGGGRWGKNYYHSGSASDRGRAGPTIGGGPARINFPSTIGYRSERGRNVHHADDGEVWAKNRYHGGDSRGKNYYLSGGASDRSRNGPIIGGGPKRTHLPSTSHHRDDSEDWAHHTSGGSDKGTGGPTVAGSPLRTNFPSTVYHSGMGRMGRQGDGGGWDKGVDGGWGRNHHHGSGDQDMGRGGKIIGGGPTRGHFSSTSYILKSTPKYVNDYF